MEGVQPAGVISPSGINGSVVAVFLKQVQQMPVSNHLNIITWILLIVTF